MLGNVVILIVIVVDVVKKERNKIGDVEKKRNIGGEWKVRKKKKWEKKVIINEEK
jgi:hypothetical protein